MMVQTDVIGHDTCNSRSKDPKIITPPTIFGVSEVIPLRSKSRQVGQNEAISRSSDHPTSNWAAELLRSVQVLETSLFHFYMDPGRAAGCGWPVPSESQCQAFFQARPLALIGQGGVHQDATEQMNDACSVRVSSLSGNGRAEEDRSWVEFLMAWFTSRVVQRSSFLYPSDHFLGPSGSFWSVSKAVLPARVPDKLCHRLDWLWGWFQALQALFPIFFSRQGRLWHPPRLLCGKRSWGMSRSCLSSEGSIQLEPTSPRIPPLALVAGTTRSWV